MSIKNKYRLSKPEKKISRRNVQYPRHQKNQWFIRIGLTLVAIGFIGSVLGYLDFGRRAINDYLPTNTAYYIRIDPTEIPVSQSKWLKDLIPNINFLSSTDRNDLTPWVGREVMIAAMNNGTYVNRFRYHNKKAAKDFLTRNILLPGEDWQKIEWKDPNNNWVLSLNDRDVFSVPRFGYTIFSPKFSSTISYSFSDGYLWVASDQQTLKDVLSKKTDSLGTISAYKSSKDYVGRKKSIELFIQTKILSELYNVQQQNVFSPILDGIIDVTPAIVVTADMKKKRFQWQLRFISSKNNNLELSPINTPELANFSPSEPILFFTGQDLPDHYKQMHEFLATLHPQFAEIFDGIWQAQSENIFGPNFDFQTDLLSQIHGQYSIIIDSNLSDQRPNFTLITGFGISDTAAKIEQFQEALRFAQGKTTARVITIDLPGGTEQEQAVNLSASELVVNEYPMTYGSVYEVKNLNLGRTIYFGFREQYFVLSASQHVINQLFDGSYQTLTENSDFRDTVLFKHKPAESYGYISLKESQKAFEHVFLVKDLIESTPTTERDFLEDIYTDNNRNFTWFDQLNMAFDSVVFSKKRDADDVWWEIDLVE